MNWEAFKQTKFAIKCTSDKNLLRTGFGLEGDRMTDSEIIKDLECCKYEYDTNSWHTIYTLYY